jgi:hypothetical protein
LAGKAGLNRPSSNATGISFMVADLSATRVELLLELRLLATRLGLLVNPGLHRCRPRTRSEWVAVAAYPQKSLS